MILAVDAGPGVLDRELRTLFGGPPIEPHFAAGRRVAERVAEQIGEHLGDALGVGRLGAFEVRAVDPETGVVYGLPLKLKAEMIA